MGVLPKRGRDGLSEEVAGRQRGRGQRRALHKGPEWVRAGLLEETVCSPDSQGALHLALGNSQWFQADVRSQGWGGLCKGFGLFFSFGCWGAIEGC